MFGAWAVIVSCIAPLNAQEITESWVAEQLGGARSTPTLELDREAAYDKPILSLMIRYLPKTGALTLASAVALRPLYKALQVLAPVSFRVVCCTGLPKDREAELARQLVADMTRLLTNRQSHVQFQVQVRAPELAILPQVYPTDVARIDVYRLP